MQSYTFKGRTPQIHASAYLAPGAMIVGNVDVGKESSIWFNAVLRGDNEKISIGNGSNIQDGAILHVDEGFPLTIADNVTVGHNAILHGCTIEQGALIGMGATILNGAIIEKGALVAAGSLIPEGKRVKAGTLVGGIPGKYMKDLTDEQINLINDGSNIYIKESQQYKEEKIVVL